VKAAGRIDELRRDPHAPFHFANGPFEDVSHSEVAPHVSHLHGLSLVREGRVAGDDEQLRNAGKIGNQLLGDPVAKVLLLRILAHVREGQHDDGGFVGERGIHRRAGQADDIDDETQRAGPARPEADSQEQQQRRRRGQRRAEAARRLAR
jgi:hypothetical protein